jgi:ribosomal protein S18 acetylase RimI-like enzyme
MLAAISVDVGARRHFGGRTMEDQGTIDAEVELRPARPQDAASCAAIFNAWVDATDWMPRVHPPEAVERHFRETVLPKRAVMVAERAGEVVGFLALAEGHVDGLYLTADARRQGLGRALISLAKAASPEGLTLWTFVSNTAARAFYARQGFVELSRTDGGNEEALPDILLAWSGAR